ncbi:MAG: hypothetical protein ACE5H6_04990 [Dehalococcoidia bacterium]
MSLYLVRWPDLSVSIVRARDRQELDHILDEVSDPGACEIKQYNGPFHIALELDVEYEVESEPSSPAARVSLKNVSECKEHWGFRLSEDNGDIGYFMWEQIVQFAYPHYASYLDVLGWGKTELDEKTLDKACKEAMAKEFERMNQYRLQPWSVQRQ